MAQDVLRHIRFVGRRLRNWRGGQNWSGPETAAKLARPGFDWPALRSFEQGEALPGIEEATKLAELFGHSLIDLLAVASVDRPAHSRQVVPVHELPQIRRALDEHALDVDLATRFFEAGESSGRVQAWLKSFSVEEALTLAESGIGPIEAGDWMADGHSVDQAALLKRSGFSVSSARALVGSDSGGSLVVLALRRRLGISHEEGDFARGLERLDELSVIPWTLAGVATSHADAWAVQGFTASQAVALRGTFDPEEAGEWLTTGIDMDQWTRWIAAGVTSTDARTFVEEGMSIEEACRWREASIDAQEAAEFHSSHFGLDAATSWRNAKVPLSEAKRWNGHGLSPKDRERWFDVASDPQVVKAWIKSAVPTIEAKEWAAGGVHPKKVRNWIAQGFDSKAATLWRGTSPERARRLVDRGVSPNQEQGRRMRGVRRLAKAKAVLSQAHEPNRGTSEEPPGSWPTPSDQTVSADLPSTHLARGGPILEVCKACNEPIGVNGICGCS